MSIEEDQPMRPFAEGPRIQAQSLCRCFGTGIVQAKLRGGGEGQTGYAFRCPCRIGDRRDKRFPIWNDDMTSEYEVFRP